ncbi:MAG: hydrogen gas-evolving membrane-bound hydrogenase subunit E [Thermodesulfobacteriota bacterium]
MKLLAFLMTFSVGVLLLIASLDLPDWSNPESPASTHLSPHYIEKSLEETSVPNLVTSVLADYRGYDTMFETVVIFCAGITVLIMLRRTFMGIEKYVKPRPKRESADIILQSAVRLLVPVMQVFALYVVAHGHHSPGGGFQGGVIFGASFILLAIAYDLKVELKKFREHGVLIFSVVGVLIYAGIGIVCLLLGGNFLAYAAWAKMLGISELEAHSLGMLGVEIGVAITVMAIMFSLYADLSSSGDLDEGL